MPLWRVCVLNLAKWFFDYDVVAWLVPGGYTGWQGEEKMPHNRRTAEEISELAYDQAMLTCTCVVAPRLQHGLYLSDALSQVIRGHLMPLPSQILDHQPHQL